MASRRRRQGPGVVRKFEGRPPQGAAAPDLSRLPSLNLAWKIEKLSMTLAERSRFRGEGVGLNDYPLASWLASFAICQSQVIPHNKLHFRPGGVRPGLRARKRG